MFSILILNTLNLKIKFINQFKINFFKFILKNKMFNKRN